MLDFDRLISARSRELDTSGIRRVFELGATMRDPINLSIGQPDFGVPEAIRRAAVEAIEGGQNGYSLTTGTERLRRRCAAWVREDVGWPLATKESAAGGGVTVCVTSGTSGALFLLNLAVLQEPGDEIVIPDPYFVAYEPMARIAGGRAVRCETYPDFRMTAEKIEPLINERTKAVLINSPGNPTGVVLTQDECRDILELCRSRGVLLVSDEIYDEFTFADAREEFANGMKCPSPCREAGSEQDVLLIRGFGKTYGCTGWRLGYVAGPAGIVGEIAKLSQYSYVCAPTPLQAGVEAAFEVDMGGVISEYEARRELVLEKMSGVAGVARPGGAFYAFVEVPEGMGMTGHQVFEACAARGVLLIPGGVFSSRDTHVRVSMAAPRERLSAGLDVLADVLGGCVSGGGSSA